MSTSITVLKSYFENNKKPTEQQFYELIDAFIHRDENFANFIGQFASVSEAGDGVATDKYMNPFLVKTAINEMVRLANISQLSDEVDVKDSQVKVQLRGGITTDKNTLKKLFNWLNANKEPKFSKASAFNSPFGVGVGEVLQGDEILWRGQINTDLGSAAIVHSRGSLNPTIAVNSSAKEVVVTHNINTNPLPLDGSIQEYYCVVSAAVDWGNSTNLHRFCCNAFVVEKSTSVFYIKYMFIDTLNNSVNTSLNSAKIDVVIFKGNITTGSGSGLN